MIGGDAGERRGENLHLHQFHARAMEKMVEPQEGKAGGKGGPRIRPRGRHGEALAKGGENRRGRHGVEITAENLGNGHMGRVGQPVFTQKLKRLGHTLAPAQAKMGVDHLHSAVPHCYLHPDRTARLADRGQGSGADVT